jgi:hypothetical protein
MCARLPAEAIPRTQQAIDRKQTLITVSFTAQKLIILDVRLKGITFDALYFINYFSGFGKFKTEFRRRTLDLAFRM